MTSKRRISVFSTLMGCTILASTTLISAAANAQAAAEPAPAAEADSAADEGGAIVVTARRRAEALQDVPLSIAAFSAQDLANSGVEDLRDLNSITPGLTVNDQGAGFYTVATIRGLAQLNTNNGLVENNVAVFLNGVYLPNPGALNLSLLNLQRIEVVKGPVSSLYGRSAFAGAINYVSQSPSDTLTGTFTGTIGTAGRRTASAIISGPLADGIKASIGGVYDTYDGTWDDPVNGNNAGGFTKKNVIASLEADLSDSFKVSLMGYYGKDKFDPVAEYHLANNCGLSSFGVLQQYCGRMPEADQIEVPNSLNSGATGNDRQVTHIDAHLDWDLGGGYSLSGILGYNKQKSKQFLEINNRRDGLTYGLVPLDPTNPATPATTQTVNLNEFYGDDLRNRDLSAELRLSSPQNGNLRWSIGGFAYESKGHQYTNVTLPNDTIPDGYTINSPLAALWLTPGADPSTLQARHNVLQKAEQYSAFGELEYAFDNGLTLSQELRFTHERKWIHQLQNAVVFPDPANGIPPGGLPQDPKSRTFNYVNSRSTIKYEVNPQLTVYASAANGTKSGGFNPRAVLDADKLYDPEKNWTEEVGVKGSLLDGRFYFDAAAYHIKWTSMQITGPGSDPANPAQMIKNYGAARNWGFEIDTQTRITDEVKLLLGASVNDAKFSKGAFDAQYAGICPLVASCAGRMSTLNGQPVIDLAGLNLPRQSKFQLTAGLDVKVPVTEDWSATANIRYSYSTKQYFEPANFAYWTPSHNLNGRIGFENDAIKITLWADNILNKKNPYMAQYNIRINDFVFETLPLYQEKRTGGITASFKF